MAVNSTTAEIVNQPPLKVVTLRKPILFTIVPHQRRRRPHLQVPLLLRHPVLVWQYPTTTHTRHRAALRDLYTTGITVRGAVVLCSSATGSAAMIPRLVSARA